MSYDLGRRRRGAVKPSPLFLTVLAVTAVGAVISWVVDTPGSRLGDFGVFLFVLGGWVASVCVHEFAHAYAAYRAGDRSVEARGYLTLNPFKYTHPVLSILLPLVAIVGGGFALPGGAVYLNPHSFRSRAQRSLAAAAGPLTNVVFAVVLILVARNHVSVTDVNAFFNHQSQQTRFWGAIGFLGLLQVTAAVLNLLPIPGLDGYGIIEPYLDPETVRVGEKVKPWGLFIVILLLFYATPVKNAFFDVVDAIYRGIGGTDLMHAFGYQSFRWWAKPPL
ncbi:MAG TPA: site-2 protease family protein [Jatrophihabitans sp.]|nr:site-2 protease family protein [Jatrophihabitans sp.]